MNDTFEEEAVLMHDALHEAYMDDDLDHTDEVGGSGTGSATQGDGVDVGGLDPFMSDPRLVVFFDLSVSSDLGY